MDSSTDPVTGKDPLHRLCERVTFRPDGCWQWRGKLCRGGYGGLSVRGRMLKAHRFAYALLRGPIPEGLHLDHLCRNRACVNPEHLEPVTREENLRRGTVRPYRLTHETAAEVREAMDALCAKYGVRPQTLADVAERRTWKPVAA